MKESITKFDLEAAFKALDEIDIPTTKGLKANRPSLTETLSRTPKFDKLFEEYYDISSTDELNGAKESREAEIAKAKLARIEKIVDLDAESPEDLLTSYVGKYIIQCPQCMTLFYKNKEDVVESEDDPNTVNIEEKCQHCGNDSGYTLIGKVGEADSADAQESEAEEEEVPASEDDLDLFSLEDEENSEEAAEQEENTDGEDAELNELDDLDLEIEDDEEEETKEESFTQHSGSPLNEDLLEDTDLDISESEFEELINSPEFKQPISDSAVQAMLGNDDDDDLGESIEVNGETLKYAVINPDGTYAGVPCVAFEEARDLAAQKEGRVIVELIDLKKNSTDSRLNEAGLKDLGQAIGKKIKQTGAKIKGAASDAIDRFVDSVKTRDEKADWILKNAQEGKDKKFKQFIIIGFKDKYVNGKEITMAPGYDVSDLVLGDDQPVIKDGFKDAEKYAKGWSQTQGNGPAFIYLAKDINDDKAAPVCEYFKGKLENDQLEKYFEAVKKDLAGRELTKSQEEPKAVEGLSNMIGGTEFIQESALETLICNSLKESYSNVAEFSLNECAYLNKILFVEGLITFKSGNTRKTTYMFSNASADKNNQVTIKGLNESIGNSRLFTITGHANTTTKTFIAESLKCYKK